MINKKHLHDGWISTTPSIVKFNKYVLLALCLTISLDGWSQPTITSFVPANGSVGTSVTITGTGFDATAASNIVFFGATQATVSAATTTVLTVTVPIGATYMPITVLVNGLLAYSSAPFVVTHSGGGLINANTFSGGRSYPTGTSPNSISIGDLDGDGKTDLVVTNGTSTHVTGNPATISIFMNISSGIGNINYATKIDLDVGSLPNSISIGDLDGDGKADLAVVNESSSTVSIFRNTSQGTGNIRYATKMDLDLMRGGMAPNSVSIGDLDGDGKADLVLTNLNDVSVLRNTSTVGMISYASLIRYGAGLLPSSVSIGDLNGDGKVDLAITNKNSASVSVLRNMSMGTGIDRNSFGDKMDFRTGTNPVSVSIGDLDGDGKADLVVANEGSNNISVLKNISSSGGTINYADKIDYSTGNNPTSVSIGDLDGDGKADLAVANRDSHTVSVLKNTNSEIGMISYAAKVDYGTGGNSFPRAVSIGDLDGDGESDLAITNLNARRVTVIRNIASGREITTFSVPGQISSTIDQVNLNIDVVVPVGTDVTALVATFTLSPSANAKIRSLSSPIEESGVTANDFTRIVVYIITAEDGNFSFYYVTVSNSSPSLGIKEMVNLRIYPNPVTDYLNITGINAPYSVQLLNIPGQIVYDGTNDRSLNLLNFDKGIYYLKITVENGNYQTWKIIKN